MADVADLAVAHPLLERRQHHRPAGICAAHRQRLDRRPGLDGELKSTSKTMSVAPALLQPVDQFGMKLSGPWPDAEFLDRRRINRDQDNVAAGLARKTNRTAYRRAHVATHCASPKHDDCQDAQDKRCGRYCFTLRRPSCPPPSAIEDGGSLVVVVSASRHSALAVAFSCPFLCRLAVTPT